MNRETVYSLLRIATKTPNNDQLLNELQNLGLVADECAKIEDVANSDLMTAFNTITK